MLKVVKARTLLAGIAMTGPLLVGCALAYETSARDMYDVFRSSEASKAHVDEQLSAALIRLASQEGYATNMDGSGRVHDFTYAAFIWNRCGWSSIAHGPTENSPDYTLTTRASRLPVIGLDDACYEQFRDRVLEASLSVEALEVRRASISD